MTEIVDAELVVEEVTAKLEGPPVFRTEPPALLAGKHRKPEEDSTLDIEGDNPFESSEESGSAPDSGPQTSTTNTSSASTTRRPRGRPRKFPKQEANEEKGPPKLNVRPPDFSEWHNYMGDFVIKWLTRGYVAFAFRGLDRFEVLSQAENDALELDAETRHDIAKPLAHMADRSKLGRKYGRVVIDSSDGVTALIALGMWSNRVNRIAKKHRPNSRPEPHRESDNVNASRTDGTSLPPEVIPTVQPAYAGNGTRAPGVGYN